METKVRAIAFLLPHWVLVWLALAGLAAFLVGWRRLAVVLLLPPFTHWLVFPITRAVLDGLPWPVVLAAYAVMAILTLHLGLRALFGQGVADQTVGQLLADGARALLRAVLGVPRLAVRLAGPKATSGLAWIAAGGLAAFLALFRRRPTDGAAAETPEGFSADGGEVPPVADPEPADGPEGIGDTGEAACGPCVPGDVPDPSEAAEERLEPR